jgi:hypothetical protein
MVEALSLWESVKEKWDGKKIQVVLDLEPRTDDRIWWLIIPHDERNEIQSRDELVYLTILWSSHVYWIC